MGIGTDSSNYNYYRFTLEPLIIPKELRKEVAESRFQAALEAGASLEDAQNVRDIILGLGGGDVEQPKLAEKKKHNCNDFSRISDELWKELLEKHDVKKLSYEDKKRLAEDFEKYGLLSAEEKNQIVDQLILTEELSTSMKPPSVIEYDKEKYPTIYDYLRENVIDASPEACAAMKESMVVRNKFEHLIEHMRRFEENH